MHKKIGIIVNPVSGRKSKKQLVADLKAFIAAQDKVVEYDLWETEKRGHASQLAQHAENEAYTDLIIIGGDGTVNEVINGIVGNQIALSTIPTGTGNDFVKSLPWPTTLEEQFHTALYGNSQLIDLGLCNGQKFANTMGLGFDGQVVDFMEKNGKKFQGHLAYLYTVIKILFSYQEPMADMLIDGQAKKAPIFMAAINNGTTFGGGFLITPEAKVDDGLLDVCLIEKLAVWERLLHLPKVQAGKHHSVKGVSFYQMKAMQVADSQQIVGQIDGEYLGHPPFDISVLPKALRIRC